MKRTWLCAGDTEIAICAAEKYGLAVTKRDLPLALNDGAATGEIHREEKVVCDAMGVCSRVLAQTGKRSREDAGSGQELLGDSHMHGTVCKGFQRKQPTFAQAADCNAARAGGQSVGRKSKRCDRRRGRRHGL
jgi:hypothetical protein